MTPGLNCLKRWWFLSRGDSANANKSSWWNPTASTFTSSGTPSSLLWLTRGSSTSRTANLWRWPRKRYWTGDSFRHNLHPLSSWWTQHPRGGGHLQARGNTFGPFGSSEETILEQCESPSQEVIGPPPSGCMQRHDCTFPRCCRHYSDGYTNTLCSNCNVCAMFACASQKLNKNCLLDYRHQWTWTGTEPNFMNLKWWESPGHTESEHG